VVEENNMDNKEILQIVNKVYPKIRTHYGLGKKEYPPIEIYKNILVRLTGEPNAEGEPADAEYDRKENKLFLYSDYNNTTEDIIRSIIHEYIHYLQSGSWMKRFYDMGYDYGNHPYEVDAKKAEENWKMFA
jgi:hypothetical protein|tara:strand:- start:214 stop:606 length:393 start_codon:yes stop_codon:yes gene_type:complete